MQYRSRPVNRPLLVVDGDSFAHRAYHALPKSIRRSGNRDGGAIVGFANLLLRLYDSERPRAVLVGWDTPVRRRSGSDFFRPIRAVVSSMRS
jgi:5'-3' exonuclease